MALVCCLSGILGIDSYTVSSEQEHVSIWRCRRCLGLLAYYGTGYISNIVVRHHVLPPPSRQRHDVVQCACSANDEPCNPLSRPKLCSRTHLTLQYSLSRRPRKQGNNEHRRDRYHYHTWYMIPTSSCVFIQQRTAHRRSTLGALQNA